MRSEIGFADLVRAIDRLDVTSSDEARAIAELLSPGSTNVMPEPPSPGRRSTSSIPPPLRDPPVARSPGDSADPPARPSLEDIERPHRAPELADDGDSIFPRDLPPRQREDSGGDVSTAAPMAMQPVAAEPSAFAPMIERGLSRAIVAALICREEYDGPVDLAAAIETIARERPLTRIPRRKRRTIRFGVQLLLDVGPGMAAYSLDVADLRRWIGDVVGTDRVELLKFRGPAAPLDMRSDDNTGNGQRASRKVQVGKTWRDYAYPAPKTPVLALTDLGFARGGLRKADEDRWIELASGLSAIGSSLIVLTPAPPDRWPQGLVNIATLVQWDRATAHVSRSQMRARRIEHALDTAAPHALADTTPWSSVTHPDVYTLARLVALTARCEPALLRCLRREFMRGVDAWVEGELWASSIVEIRSQAGIMLRNDVAQTLLESWSNDPSLPAVAAEIAKAHSRESPLVRMHEQLVADVARGVDDEVGLLGVRKLLGGVAAALAQRFDEPLADWTRHVMRRLPQLVESPIGFQLAVAAGAGHAPVLRSGSYNPKVLQTSTVALDPQAPRVTIDLRAQATELTSRRAIGVRRLDNQAIFYPTAAGHSVELSVPDTRPAVLTIHRVDQPPIVVAVGADPVRVAWSAGPLDVYALDGRGWRLEISDTATPTVDAPWSSIIWLPPPPHFAFGYVATRRSIVVPLEAIDVGSIDPIKLRLAGVTVQGRLLLADATNRLAVLSLADDAPVPPLPRAIARTIGELGFRDGILALELGAGTAPRGIPCQFEGGRVHVVDSDASIVSGMPVLRDGELAGMIVIGESETPGVYAMISATQIDAAVQRALDGLTGLTELATLIANDGPWSTIQSTATSLAARSQLADATLDAFVKIGSQHRSAAVLLWAFTTPPHAVRHALAALEAATRTLDIEIAVYTLTRLVLQKRLDGPHARRARRRLDKLAPSLRDDVLREDVEKLHAALKSVEGAHHELKIERFCTSRFQHRGSLELLRQRLQLRLRVLVLVGGIDGATQLGVASQLHRSVPGYIALAWTFRGDDVERFCAFAAGALGLASGATIQDVARRAAELDANVLLDRFDRLAADRDEAFAKLQAFVKPFIELRRGRCIFTCRGVVPDLGLGDACEVLPFSGIPADLEFRHHLSMSLEYHERQIDDWIRALPAWGPIAAVSAMAYVVLDTLPRWSPDRGNRVTAPFVAALRAWIDQPGRLSREQRDAFAGSIINKHLGATGNRLETVGGLMLNAMQIAEAALDDKDVDTAVLGDVLAQIALQLDPVTPSAIQAIVRRAYLGAGYVRDDPEFVVAFDRPVGNRTRDVINDLSELAGEPVVPIEATLESDKLGFRVPPVVFRRIRDLWRAGTLTMLGGLRLRWFAESNPFPAHNDVQKGHWGGLPERAGRIATATVSKPKGGWYNIRIQVTAMPDAPPIRGIVRFHLHDTFPDPIVEAPVRKGVAEFTHNVWGAFTAGIECDRGETQLEIDLADIPEADHAFLDEENAGEPGVAVASFGIELPLQEGLRWMYEPIGARRGVSRSAHVMTVTESILHGNGVAASRLDGFIGRPSEHAATSIWLITRGDGRYYEVPDDPSSCKRLRDDADELQDLMVAETLFLRFPMRTGSSFANAKCSMHVTDVRFTTVKVRGLTKNTVVYDVAQRWRGSQVRLSVAPGVGIVSAIDYDGCAWKLVSYSERRKPSARPSRKSKRR